MLYEVSTINANETKLKNPITLSIGEGLPQHKHWRFNSSLLDNNDVCNNIKEWFKYYITDNVASDVTPAVMWDAAKAVIRVNLISYTSAKKRATKARMMGLMAELSKFEQLHKQHPSEDDLKK